MTQIGEISLQLDGSDVGIPLAGAASQVPFPTKPNDNASHYTTQFLINGQAPVTWSQSFTWGYTGGTNPQQLKVVAVREVLNKALENIAGKAELFSMYPQVLGENFSGFYDISAQDQNTLGNAAPSSYGSAQDAIAAAGAAEYARFQAALMNASSREERNALFDQLRAAAGGGSALQDQAGAIGAASVLGQSAAKYKTSLVFNGPDVRNELVYQEYKDLWLLLREPVSFVEDSIIISDDRWRWDRVNVNRAYNMVRKANDFYIFRGSVALQNTLAAAKRYFIQSTINPKTNGPWTCIEIVEDILEKDLGYPKSRIHRERLGQVALTNYIPMDCYFAGVPADTAINKCLNEGNISLYLDERGDVVIYPAATTIVRTEMQPILKDLMDNAISGAVDFQDKTLVRPDKVIVEFEQERETLFHFEETEETSADSSESPARQLANQYVKIENVTRTVYNDQIPGVPRGVYVKIDEALAQFGMTKADLREHYGMGADARTIGLMRDNALGVLDQDLAVAWNSIVRDYRTLFRVPQKVMESIAVIKPYLATVVNTDSGLRAPAEVFTKVMWLSRLNRYVTTGGEPLDQGVTLDSFDTSRKSSTNSDYQPVPATVSIEDPDLGVFRVNYVGELNRPGYSAEVVPGEPIDPGFFSDNLALGESYNSKQALVGQFGLKEEWQIGIVMCVVPLFPNNNSKMWWEEADPTPGVSRGKGPPVIIKMALDSYRKALPDSLKAWRNQTYAPNEGPVNKRVVQGLASNEGNRVWLSFADHVIGQVTSRIPGGRAGPNGRDPLRDLRPHASMNSVLFTVDRTGGYYVTASCVPSFPPPDIRNLLSRELLAATMRQVDFNRPVNGQKVSNG